MNCRLHVVVLHRLQWWVIFTLPGLSAEVTVQFRQGDKAKSRSVERAVILLRQEFLHASLGVKVENSGPGDRLEGHTGLGKEKEPRAR